MRKLAALIAFAFGTLVLASACGGGGGAIGKIQTAGRQYSMTKVEVGDRFPLGCSDTRCAVGPPDCSSCLQRLKDGHQVLAVWVTESQGERDDLYYLCVQPEAEEEQIYIAASGGAQSPCTEIVSFWVEEIGRQRALLFTPPASAQGFTLFVPDNPPIDLGK